MISAAYLWLYNAPKYTHFMGFQSETISGEKKY